MAKPTKTKIETAAAPLIAEADINISPVHKANGLSLVSCTVCLYRIGKQCRLNPPVVSGGFSVYPCVVSPYGENHGCFKGEVTK